MPYVLVYLMYYIELYNEQLMGIEYHSEDERERVVDVHFIFILGSKEWIAHRVIL